MTRFFVLMGLCFFVFQPTQAQFQRILGPTASTWVLFGESVSMHGNYAVVGEPARDANGLIHEKVHVYRLNNDGWTRIQTFLSQTITGQNDMGGRTGMSDNWLAFSQISGTNSNRYFLYQKQADTFALKQTIQHPDPWNNNFICKTIALTDEHLIVGGAGFAYCYRINPATGLWELKQTISKSGGTEFGNSIAIHENRAVITANLEDAAYAFEYINDTWIQRARIVPADAGNHQFGANCAIYKDLVAVTDFGGSYNTGADVSKAYLYNWQNDGTISQVADLRAPNSINHSNFGCSYYINDDFLFVGANATGSVFKFRREGDAFEFARQYRTPDPSSQPLFGEGLAGHGNQLLIGDPHFGVLRGAVYQTYVYDSLYAVLDCQLPVAINGNSINSNNLNLLFESDPASVQAGKPAKFGVIEVERLFTDMNSVHICENLDSDTVSVDFTQGYQLLIPDGYYARWTAAFDYNGQTITASDILDDTTSFRPRFVNTYPVGRVDFNLEFGVEGQNPCMTFPLTVYMGRVICPAITDTIDMMAGDTITLFNACQSLPSDGFQYHNWSSIPDQPNTFLTTFQDSAKIFPLVNTLYQYWQEVESVDFEFICSDLQQTYDRVTAEDADGDGFPFYLDCDDTNPLVNPSATEIPFNGLDDDCEDGDDGFCLQRQPSPGRGVDAMVLSDMPDTNFGLDDDLNVGHASNFPPNRKIRSYLKFDLSTIPQGAVIDSAFLSLYWNPTDNSGIFGRGHFDGTGNPGSAQLAIDRVRENWDQNSVKWNSSPLVSTANRVRVSHSLYPGGTSDFTNMNITPLIGDLLDPSLEGNLGLRLSILPLNNVRQLIFASSNHPDAERRPKLELCWHSDSISVARETYSQTKISVYPNPATEVLHISSSDRTLSLAQIIDMDGRVITTIHMDKPRIAVDVSGFVPGIYSIKFEDGSVRVFSIARH